MKFEDYRIEIAPLPKDEGGGYLVTVPDLPGCIADGDTIESAVAEARDAFEAWARAEREDAGALPAPGTAYERLPRKEGACETARNESIASVPAHKHGSARAKSDEPAEPGDSPSRLKSARRAPSVAGAGSGEPTTPNRNAQAVSAKNTNSGG